MKFNGVELKVEESNRKKDDFNDPLRVNDGRSEVSASDIKHEDISSDATVPQGISAQLRARKEWVPFKRILMQRFPVSKTSPLSLVGVLVD